MNTKKFFASMFLVLGLGVLFGCGGASSQFPLPDSVENFTELGSADSVNFQTKKSLNEIVIFYRTEFAGQEIVERGNLTVIEGKVASLVFDGHSSGKAIVLQIVELDSGMSNVNIRLEEV